jgi:hypothetical protein
MPRQKKVKQGLDPEIFTKSGKLRKRKPKKSREYFDKNTEDSIVAYLASTNEAERNKLFNENINYSFHKLAENIIHTFKFYYTELDNVEDLKHEVVVFLLEKLHNYDQTKGKAYSYFGTIAKRYLIVYNENNYKKLKSKAELEDVDEDKRIVGDLVREYEENGITSIIDSYVKYVQENMDRLFPSDGDQTIVIAILEIFKRRETLEVFNKQHFYFFIREITGQTTPNITRVVKELKRVYKQQLNVLYLKGELETDEVDIY